MIFINERLLVKHVGDENDEYNNIYNFSVDIKDFDTPFVNVKYDNSRSKIVSMWVDTEEDDNEPKNHVAYKLLQLSKVELKEIIKFMITHL